MSAINFGYNSDLIYSIIRDNKIILKEKVSDKLVYNFPIPKNFQISGVVYNNGDNYPEYVITPYKLNPPRYIPKGYGNLRIGIDGLYHVDDGYYNFNNGVDYVAGIIRLAYIDTTILNESDFEYPTLGKFKINNDEIPEPFWVVHFNDYYPGWERANNIENVVRKFNENARLINEEELISIFALNDKGMEFWEQLPEDIYDESFLKDPKKYALCANEFSLDNWDIVAASRENRKVYRKIYRDKSRLFNERFWYRNLSFTNGNDKPSSFHIFPVLDETSKAQEELGKQILCKKI